MTADRLRQKYFRKAMEESEPWLIVVDECHLVQDWGVRFGPDYLKIGAFVNSLSHRPTMLAMTATASPADRETICRSLGMIAPEKIVYRVDKPGLPIIVDDRSDHALGSKSEHMSDLLDCVKKNIEKYGMYGSVIVYALTPKDVTIIANSLKARFLGQIVESHSDLPNWKRADNERLFMMDKCWIMVTTYDSGRGIDKDDVSLVIHFGLPLSTVDFCQQILRADKGGGDAHAVVIYDKELMKQNETLISSAPKEAQEQMRKQQKELETIITGDNCIMQGLLKPLGEKQGRCGQCSICRQKKKK